MDLQQLLAAILNPNGSQQAPIGPAPSAVGDHNNPAALMQAQQGLAQPHAMRAPQMPQQQPQQAMPPQMAPQGQSQAYAGVNPINSRPILDNGDGSYSTEESITVTDPRLNGGRPTNIPSIWGGRRTANEKEAIAEALRSGQQFGAFNSIPEAVSAAKARSKSLDAGVPGGSRAPSGTVGGFGGLGGILQNIIAPQSAARNKTAAWLQSQGMDGVTASAVASDPQLLRSVLSQRMQGQKLSDFDQRAQAAQQYGLDPSTPEGRNFILSGNLPEARGGAAELGLNPQTGVDKDGNPVLIQIGKDGNAVQTRMPDGVSLSKTPIKIDAGTEWIILDPITRQPVGRIPKDIAGAEREKAVGQGQGAAAFDLPRVEQNAAQTLGVLERMKTHPGRAGSTGFIEGMLPSRSSDQVDFQSLVDQTQGQSFLQAFQMLKGAGQITEIEGTKATDAISRLRNQRLSDADYLRAIGDLEGVIKTGLARAQQQAGGRPGVDVGAPGAVTPGGQRVLQQMTNPQPMGDGWSDLGGGVRIRVKQ